MLNIPSHIYISSENVDMRKSIDGLAFVVEQTFKLDPFSDAMFVFRNRACDKLKILYWDTNGFCLFYKRLEHGKFSFERSCTDSKYRITKEELHWLIAGLNIGAIKKYKSFCDKRAVESH